MANVWAAPGTAYAIPDPHEGYPRVSKIIVDCAHPYELEPDIPMAEGYDYLAIEAKEIGVFDSQQIGADARSFRFEELLIEPEAFIGIDSNIINVASVVFMAGGKIIARWKQSSTPFQLDLIFEGDA